MVKQIATETQIGEVNQMEILPKSSNSKIGEAPTGFLSLAASSMMTEMKRNTWKATRTYLSHSHGEMNIWFWLITPIKSDTENNESRPSTAARMYNLSVSPKKNQNTQSARTSEVWLRVHYFHLPLK